LQLGELKLNKNSQKPKRPSWDTYFIEMVDKVAERATCDRGKSGALIVRDKRVLCSGYVGSPPGMPHCDDVGHQFKKIINEDGSISQHCVRTIHAEQNAISQAAKYGIALDGTTLYCTMEPCLVCARLIVSAGIKRVVAKRKYHAAQESRELFSKANVELETLEDVVENYHDQ
jgi:dCMP deaminase